jgi:hypothetical protein
LSRIPEFEIKESENFKVIYAMGAFGGLAPNDGRMVLYMDLIKTKPVRGEPGKEELDKIIRERLVEIHMSPATWKSMAKWMMAHVETIEKQIGTIPEEPKPIGGKPGDSHSLVV